MQKPIIKKREVIIVLGRTGQGKSIWSRQFLSDKKRLLAYDPLQDVNVDYLSTPDLIKFAEGIQAQQGRRALAQFRLGTQNFEDAPLLDSCAFSLGNCWLFLEEASVIFPSRSVSPEWIRKSIFLGRHRSLSMLVTAQRPTSIPVDLRSQASRIICFSQHEKNDVQWMQSYFGDESDMIGQLEPLECLDATATEVKRYKIDPKNDDIKQVKKVDEKGQSYYT